MQFSSNPCSPGEEGGWSGLLLGHKPALTCPHPPDTLSLVNYMLTHGLSFMAVSLSAAIVATLIARSYKVKKQPDSAEDNVSGQPAGSGDPRGPSVGSALPPGTDRREVDLSSSSPGGSELSWPFETFGITLGMQYLPGLGPLLEALSGWLDKTSKAVPAVLALKLGCFSLSGYYGLRVFLARIDHEVGL